jgi:thioredoxin 1
MATVEVTAKNFEETVGGDGITIIDFWATWCPPCRAFAPVFQRASENHPDITFAKVDTEAEQELAMAYDIQSIPTVMAIRDGILVFNQAGALPEKALETLIAKVRELDMAEVRAKVETGSSS